MGRTLQNNPIAVIGDTRGQGCELEHHITCSLIDTFYLNLMFFIYPVAFLCLCVVVVVNIDSMHAVCLFSTLSEHWLYGF